MNTEKLCQITQDNSNDNGTLSDREMGGIEWSSMLFSKKEFAAAAAAFLTSSG